MIEKYILSLQETTNSQALCTSMAWLSNVLLNKKYYLRVTDIKKLQIHQRGLQIQAFERDMLSNIVS